MKLLCHLSAVLLLTGSGFAAGLGSLGEKPWLGTWAGMDGRAFDFSIRTDGSSEIHFKKGGKRGLSHSIFLVRYVLEEQSGGKWIRRKMAEDSVDSAQDSTLEAEKLTFTASFTGDTKIAVVHEFEKSEVYVSVKILEKKTKNPVRVGVEVVVPDFYRHVESDMKGRELKKALKGHEYRIVRLDGKKLRLNSGDLSKTDLKLESPDLLGTKGVKVFEVESDKMNGHEVRLTTVEEDCGELQLKQTKPLYHGLYAIWWPKEDKIGQEGCRLEIKVK